MDFIIPFKIGWIIEVIKGCPKFLIFLNIVTSSFWNVKLRSIDVTPNVLQLHLVGMSFLLDVNQVHKLFLASFL